MGNGKAALKDDNTFNASFNEPSGFGSLVDEVSKDIKVYVADCNNHCIRQIMYDSGDARTIELKGVPSPEGTDIDNDETEGTTTNKSGVDDGQEMQLECDGGNCYPKFF